MTNLQETTEEIWKDVPGYEGRYKISNTGKILSLARQKKGGYNNISYTKNRILKQATVISGYFQVKFSINSVERQLYTHCLVAQAFIPNPENKPQVNHINGIKKDNRVENLEWCTPKENTAHAERTGLARHRFGEECLHATITNNDARLIKTLVKTMRVKDIMILTGLKRHIIVNIKCNRAWKRA